MHSNNATAILSLAFCCLGLAPSVQAAPAVKSVEFIGMSPPSTVQERADIYTKAQLKVTYANGQTESFDLKYHLLMGTTDIVKNQVVGGSSMSRVLPSWTAWGRWLPIHRTEHR